MTALDENPNCAETYASFLLIGDRLDPEAATRRLRVKPERSFPKGTIRPSKAGRLRQRTGVWIFTTEGVLASTSLERHLRYLLDELEPRTEEIQALVDRDGLEAVFSCFWVSATGHGGPVLSPEVLNRVARVGAALWFDLYGLTEIEVES
jgi:Domain of unknown function (DUF4279)